jgi:NAD-dependent DNA ligase
MREYILTAPLTAPADTSELAQRLQQLAKACADILSDGKIFPEEADALKRWLDAAGWLKRYWPASVLSMRVNRLLDKPDEKELAELVPLLQEIASKVPSDDCEHDPNLFDAPVPVIQFEGRSFCFTGVFYCGNRFRCEEAVTDRGGIVRRQVSGSTNYVVVGGISNPQWGHANEGTKIEAARMFRQEAIEWNSNSRLTPKNVPAIVRERDFVAPTWKWSEARGFT